MFASRKRNCILLAGLSSLISGRSHHRSQISYLHRHCLPPKRQRPDLVGIKVEHHNIPNKHKPREICNIRTPTLRNPRGVRSVGKLGAALFPNQRLNHDKGCKRA